MVSELLEAVALFMPHFGARTNAQLSDKAQPNAARAC